MTHMTARNYNVDPIMIGIDFDNYGHLLWSFTINGIIKDMEAMTYGK